MQLQALSLEGDACRSYARPVETPGKIFGQNVKRIMKGQGLTQADLQEGLGVKQGAVSDWLRGRRPGVPEGITLLKFAKLLKCRVEELLVGIDHDYDDQLQSLPLNPRDGVATVSDAHPAPSADTRTTHAPPGESLDVEPSALSVRASEGSALNPHLRTFLMRIATVIHETVGAADAAVRGQIADPRAHKTTSRTRRRRGR